MAKTNARTRSKVKPVDMWDLSSLCPKDSEWEKQFKKWEKQIKKYATFQGKLGESAKSLAACLKFDSKFDREGERIGTYAFLKTTEDQANSTYQRMMGRFQNVASQANQAASYIRPEILKISAAKMKKFLAAKELAPFRLQLERLRRYKPHTLSDKEEKLLAMQSEMASASGQIFRQLTDADMKFGTMKDEKGKTVELTQASFSKFLISPKRAVRKQAFHLFYDQISGHENCLAASLAGSIQKDVYYAQARGYNSAIEQSLFAEDVPVSVYDNLIAAVRAHLPAQHRYYKLRQKKMRLKDLRHYDTYVPILSNLQKKHTWKQATSVILKALEPLGSEYNKVLKKGLEGRWCDRYPNQGKQSGAFSCGTFDGDPYILMNYHTDVLRDVFTLAHEAGHSMHSYYSAKHQPYEYYNYTIFVAEVASTFNEQLLGRELMKRAKTDQEKAFLINQEIDGIRSTIVRQTMFAEFEKITHAMCEAGEPLTVDAFKQVYGDLLAAYFGPDFAIDEELKLECLRIPHFYRAFYVYKYATGLSAAIALSERVLNGGKAELKAYLAFLSGGCSKYPLELLRDAGVDMEKPAPVEAALNRFEQLVDELETLL